ncbi:hypothetical protein GWI33_003678 [Rhynchophorus ferrugineus]|uniref:Uncharacterized protein n=1 Tax=Rhynchophorus ferrugineus TaxID=354439 RepID=A0A834IJB5_RHYFE|nr:hypothetical protein GWI33_003678 [Rhynchophorus ferrugineus]
MEIVPKTKEKARICEKIVENGDDANSDCGECDKDVLSDISSVSDEDRLQFFTAFRRRLSLPVQKMRGMSWRNDRSNSLIVTRR